MDSYKDSRLLCCKRKHNIFFGKGNSIFNNRNSNHSMQREDGVGVRGQREELGVTGMDATATLFSIQNSNGPHLSWVLF